MTKFITTSWDDGYPLDFRIADLLDKYGIKGTFYIPRTNPQNQVMTEQEIQTLAQRHAVGGHTLNHVNLLQTDLQTAGNEISGSRQWLTDLIGKDITSFCPPFGAYNNRIIQTIHQAGFKYIRGTQLLTTKTTTPVSQTTLQVYQHSSFTYFKHLALRFRFMDLIYWLSSGPTAELLKLTDHYLEKGENFHLWGHSWEIERYQLWSKLEILLAHLANRAGHSYIENMSD